MTERIMDISINRQALSFPEGATIAEALATFGAQPPFAVALNGEFVARGQYASVALTAGDALDVVHPVSGG